MLGHSVLQLDCMWPGDWEMKSREGWSRTQAGPEEVRTTAMISKMAGSGSITMRAIHVRHSPS